MCRFTTGVVCWQAGECKKCGSPRAPAQGLGLRLSCCTENASASFSCNMACCSGENPPASIAAARESWRPGYPGSSVLWPRPGKKIDASSFGSKTAPGTYFVAWINSRDKFPRHHVGQYRVSFPFSNDHQYFYWIDPDDRMSLEDLIALLNEKTTSEQDGCSEREGRR